MDRNESKGCLYFAVFAFALAAFKPLLALISGTSTEEINSMESYDSKTDSLSNDMDYFKFTSGLLIIAVIIFFRNKLKKD